MRAFVVEHLKTPGAFKDIPDPRPDANEVLIRVTAASVNPIDWKIIADPGRGGKTLPFVAGQDFAGVVEGLGTGARRFGLGDRIFGIARTHGAFAEYTVVAEADGRTDEPLCKIPDEVGDADAASLPTAGLTALAALERLQLGNGSSLLIIGATGGVGIFAIQLAKLRGTRVIGTAHSGTEDLARSFGADEVIAYDRQDTAQAIAAAHPDGIDAILDLAWDADTLKTLAPIVRKGAMIVSTIGSFDKPWFAERGIDGENIVMGRTPQSSHEGLRTLVKLVESNEMRVPIAAERALQDTAQALGLSKSGVVHGKIVITVD